MLVNLAALIYQGKVGPLKLRFDNCLENFNSLMVCFCTICIVLFTDWVPTQSLMYDYGWLFLGLLAIQIFVNVLVINRKLLNIIKLLVIYYYNRITQSCEERRKQIAKEEAE